jgi:hypothetical protein
MEKKIFSLGFRCSSASILKRLNLKQESYPFDWLISNISVVKDCIENNFEEFLNKENYERKYTNTYETAYTKNQFICDEHLMANMHYQHTSMHNEENTYKWSLAMNHHNIKEDTDYNYYLRCVSRFNELIESPNEKIFVHIQPLMPKERYDNNSSSIVRELIDFDMFIKDRMHNRVRGLYFILIKDSAETNYLFSPKCIYKTEYGSSIYILNTPSNFIDAGENFMGDCQGIIQYIENIIRSNI